MSRWAYALLFLSIGSIPACKGCGEPRSALLADAAPAPRLTAAAAAVSSSALLQDPLWKQAQSGDPMDLTSLAVREGAQGLLDGLEQGGPLGMTALLALPYAEDAPLGLRRLGEIALQTTDQTQKEVVLAILKTVSRHPSSGEPADPEGTAACAQALLELCARSSTPKPTRALVISALRRMAEQGIVQGASIPTDMDEK